MVAVLEYACEGGFVSSKDWRNRELALDVSVLVCKGGVVDMVLRLNDSGVSCGLTSPDRGRETRSGGGEVGELCAERYRLLDEGRFRGVGSEKLAIALVVFSLAKAAKLSMPARFGFKRLVDWVDWRWCLKVFAGGLGEVDGSKGGELKVEVETAPVEGTMRTVASWAAASSVGVDVAFERPSVVGGEVDFWKGDSGVDVDVDVEMEAGWERAIDLGDGCFTLLSQPCPALRAAIVESSSVARSDLGTRNNKALVLRYNRVGCRV